MILHELTLENFGPYQGEHQVSFPPAGVMIIHGDNGFGKTSILNALNWCLYGEVSDRIGKRVVAARLFNSDAREDGARRFSAGLKFSHRDPGGADHEYKLRRIAQVTHQPAGGATHLDLEQVLEVEIDNVIYNSGLYDDTVNQVLPRGVSRFFLFDGEMISEYEDLVAEEVGSQGVQVKQSIEMVLGVPSAQHGKEDLETLVSEYDGKYATQARRSTKSKKAGIEIERLRVEQARVRNDLAGAKKSNTDANRKLREARDHLATFEEFKDDAQILIRVDQEMNSLYAMRENWEERRRNAAARLWKDVINARVQVRLTGIDEEIEMLGRADGAVHSARQHLAGVQQSIGDGSCHTCKQSLPKKKIAQFEVLRKNAETDLAVAEAAADPERLEEIKRAALVLRTIVPAGVAAEIASLENDMKLSVVRERKLQRERDQATERLKGRDPRLIERYERDEVTFLSMAAKAAVIIKNLDEELRGIDGGIATQRALISADHNPEMVAMEAALNFMREVSRYFSESVDILIERMREAVQEGANSAFAQISDRNLYSGLTINQNYGLTLYDVKMRPADMRSAGYEHVVAMSLIASLNKNAAVQAPVVMDTPFGRLDPAHTTGIIKYCASMAEQVLLLVQSGEVSESDIDAIRKDITLEMDIVHPTATTSTLRKRSKA